MVHKAPDHLHPGATGQQERRLSCRAEELGGGAHRGRLPPLRHRHRVVVTQRDLAAAVQADQLLLPATEIDIQDPPRRQSVQETRQGSHPVSPRDHSPKHDRGAHRRADPDLLPDQPRRHPAPDPSPNRATPWVSPETVEGSSMLPPAGWQRSSRTRPAAATRRSYGDGGCCRSRSTRPSQPLVPGPWW